VGRNENGNGNVPYLFVHKNPEGGLTPRFSGKTEKTWSWKSRVWIPLKGCIFWQRPRNIICVHGFNCPHGCVRLQSTLHNILEEGGTGFLTFWCCWLSPRLVMYCIDATQRTVTKSLYRTALPLFILKEIGVWMFSTIFSIYPVFK